jgi:hypothetical protein
VRRTTVLALTLFITEIGATAQSDGAKFGDYVATGAIELGWRFVSVCGSETSYRTQLDLPEGPLLSFARIELRRPEGGGWLDELRAEVNGWSGQPNSSARLRAQKYQTWRLDYRVDRVDSYNAVPSFANPRFDEGHVVAPHGWDRSRTTQVLDFTLLPERFVEGNFQWGRTSQSGLGRGTDLVSEGLVFQRRLDNATDTFHGGVRFKWPRLLVGVEQEAKYFDDDERAIADVTVVLDQETLDSFSRRRTSTLDSHTTRLTATSSPTESTRLEARFSYMGANGLGSFQDYYDAAGTDPTRNVGVGRSDSDAVVFDTWQQWKFLERFRLSNQLWYRRLFTAGDADLMLLFAGQPASTEASTRLARDATLVDEIRLEIDVLKGLSVRGGYRFARRDYRLERNEGLLYPPPSEEFSTLRVLDRSERQRLDSVSFWASYRFRHEAFLTIEYENGRDPGVFFGSDGGDMFFRAAGDIQLLHLRGHWQPIDWLELQGSMRTMARTFHAGKVPGRDLDEGSGPEFVRLSDVEPPLQQARTRAVAIGLELSPHPRFRTSATYEALRSTAGAAFWQSVEEPASATGYRNVLRHVRYDGDESLLSIDLTAELTRRCEIVGLYSLVVSARSLPTRSQRAGVRVVYRIGGGVSGVLEGRVADYVDYQFDPSSYRADEAFVGVRWDW